MLFEESSTWAEIGTMAQSIEQSCIALIPGQPRPTSKDARQRLALWRCTLGKGSRSPIVRALVEDAVVSRLNACLLGVIEGTAKIPLQPRRKPRISVSGKQTQAAVDRQRDSGSKGPTVSSIAKRLWRRRHVSRSACIRFGAHGSVDATEALTVGHFA